MSGVQEYQTGRFTFSSREVPLADATAPDLAAWRDGFVAFSSRETRLQAFQESGLALTWERIDQESGYVMEINLWRDQDGVLEELCMERTDCGFLVQEWKLETTAPAEQGNCYYREVQCRPRQGTASNIFTGSSVPCMEIVHPETRMHVFMSRGEWT